MSKRNIAIVIYLAIGLLFAIYGTFWGVNAHRSFMFNLGTGLVWPVVLFPSLGKAIGGLVIVAVIGALLFFGRGRS